MATALRSLALVATLAGSILVISARAQDAGAIITALVRAGTCDALGDEAAELTGPAIPSGARLGQASAIPAASSYSQVSISLDTLLAQPFVVEVVDATVDRALACGEIGGAIDGNGALSIGLRPAGGSTFAGVAYLAPAADPALTGISLFMAQTGTAAGETAQPETSTDAGDYASAVQRQVTLMVGSLQRVDALVAAPRPDDASWIDQLNAELALWQMLHAQVEAMPPPPAYAAFHERYAEAIALLDSAAADMLHALEDGDQDLLSEASQKIDEAIQILRELNTPDGASIPATNRPLLG